ncbi:hypothetical protein BV378_19310, partial [Nostoc sp. RF31YmG]
MAQARIKKLTPEQEVLMPIIRDEWLKIALDTSPTDKQKAEAAICLAYECAGLKPPQQILWFDNPLIAATWIVSHRDQLGSYMKKHILQNEEKSLIKIVGEKFWNYVWDNFSNPIVENLGETIDLTVQDTLWVTVKDAVWKGKFIDETTREFLHLREAGWLACCIYFDAIGVDCSKLKGLWETAKHCGWWWSFKEIAVVTPKPSTIRFDADNNLHAEGLPAIAYKGFNVYAYHGVRLPEKYGQLHPNQWQAQWLLEEANAELRRVLIQGIGYEKITYELQAVELDTWQEYTLLNWTSPSKYTYTGSKAYH